MNADTSYKVLAPVSHIGEARKRMRVSLYGGFRAVLILSEPDHII